MHTSTHLPGNSPSFNFGDAFDVPRLRSALGKPVLEWREVKMSNSPIVDDIGCWNTWESVQDTDRFPRHSVVPGKLNLGIVVPLTFLHPLTPHRYLLHESASLDKTERYDRFILVVGCPLFSSGALSEPCRSSPLTPAPSLSAA